MTDSTSPLSTLDLPGRVLKHLDDGGIKDVGDLALRLEDDPKSILTIKGVGPKTLLSIKEALETTESEPAEEYREPVQSLGDQFKSVPPAVPKVNEEKIKTEERAKKGKKKSKKKPQKAGKKKEKKPEKAGKKKDKEPKMADKKKDKKKDKKPKKSDDKKGKNKDKKNDKKKK